MDFDHTDTLTELGRQPVEPKPRMRSAWQAVPAAFRAVAGGVSQVIGQVQQFSAGIDERFASEAINPRVAESARQSAMALRERGDFATGFERYLRPDPATASTAENVVYGLSKGLTKAIGAVATMGPLGGAAAFGVSEAAAIDEDLKLEGVDPETRAKAALVTGAAQAASVLLPMSGPTLKATAALYLAGGPGGYLAQQAATQHILANAGYAKEAARFDPLDPVGLTLAFGIPLPFAAMGAARNIKAAKAANVPDAPPIPREAVDAAMVHNVTLLREAQDAAIKAGEPPVKIEPAAEPAPIVRVEPEATAAPAAPVAPNFGRLADTVETAKRLIDEAATQGKSLDLFLSEREVSAEVNNVMLGLRDAADDPRRLDALMRRLSREGQDQTKPAADATADAVQDVLALTEEQLKDLNTPKKMTGDAVTQQTVNRVDQVLVERPDLVTRVTEDGQQVRAADDLAAAKREAFEGVGDELGAADADLLRVAAECALSLGTI